MSETVLVYKKRLEGVKGNGELRELLQEAINSNISSEEATAHHSTVLKFHNDDSHNHNIFPIAVVRSMATLLGEERVEKALFSKTSLVFTPPPETPLTDEQKRFRQRMERLKWKQEETSYSKLTSNIGKVVTDDVTTKSMTYAASIGLNMIVAPLSFGCFMYFFGGHLLDYVWSPPTNPNGPDIRKVIIGVLSGVVMMIVEMLLFVIRTYEMDEAMVKKARRSKPGPFGYYTSNTSKTFKGE